MFERDKSLPAQDAALSAFDPWPNAQVANDRLEDAADDVVLDDVETLDAFEDDVDLDDDAEIDWSQEMFGAAETDEAPRALKPAIPVIETRAADAQSPAPAKKTTSWTAALGGVLALVWAAVAIATPFSFYGLAAVMAMDPAMQLAIVAAAVGPAALIWLTSTAVAEAARAGRIAQELLRMSDTAPKAAQSFDVRTVGAAHDHIASVNAAVDAALQRLSLLDKAAERHAMTLTAALAQDAADGALERLASERESVTALNAEMRAQTETLSSAVSRQVRLMREAAKIVRGELEGAEDVLDNHLVALKTSANVVAQRTLAMQDAADCAVAANAKLESSLGESLHTLSEATKMTDAARQSTEQAAHVAHATATAVRETTHKAVHEAKRAAQLIRQETQALEQMAGATLDKLREAADAARAASSDAQTAADKHAASIEKRLSALAGTARMAREPAAPRAPQRAAREEAFAPLPRAAQRSEDAWSNLLPNEPIAKRRPVEHLDARQAADAALIADALDMIAESGVRIEDALAPADLDRIARRAREGAQARRRAVIDAAPGAVQRIARHMRHDRLALRAATAFRMRPDLANGDKHAGSDAVCAYLLIDAALTP